MMCSMWRDLFLASILVLLFITGCGKRGPTMDPSVGTIKPVPEAKAESGWPLYQVPAEGFALALPSDWRQFDMNPTTFEARFSETLKQNPDLKGMLETIRQQIAKGIKFFGLHEPTMRTGFATNVNVLCLPLPPEGTLDFVVADTLKQLESLPSVTKPIDHERVKTPAGDCERFRYKMAIQTPTGKTVSIALTQFVFVKGATGYVMSLGSLVSQEAQYADTFEKIGQSFRFIKK